MRSIIRGKKYFKKLRINGWSWEGKIYHFFVFVYPELIYMHSHTPRRCIDKDWACVRAIQTDYWPVLTCYWNWRIWDFHRLKTDPRISLRWRYRSSLSSVEWGSRHTVNWCRYCRRRLCSCFWGDFVCTFRIRSWCFRILSVLPVLSWWSGTWLREWWWKWETGRSPGSGMSSTIFEAGARCSMSNHAPWNTTSPPMRLERWCNRPTRRSACQSSTEGSSHRA